MTGNNFGGVFRKKTIIQIVRNLMILLKKMSKRVMKNKMKMLILKRIKIIMMKMIGIIIIIITRI